MQRATRVYYTRRIQQREKNGAKHVIVKDISDAIQRHHRDSFESLALLDICKQS